VPAGTYGFLTFWNVLGPGTTGYLGYAPINGSVKGFFSVDTTLTNDRLLSVAHGLVDNDRVILTASFGGALPTGLTAGAAYYVVASTADTFKVALTQGGAAVDITAVGAGEAYFQKVIPEVFASQGQLTVAVGAVTLDATAV
jgi:hypothetical protein